MEAYVSLLAYLIANRTFLPYTCCLRDVATDNNGQTILILRQIYPGDEIKVRRQHNIDRVVH
ncbi:hypothetical protein E2C01_083103 [Portunus trituberculatus]|uniref:Uncharacterized protein n=1 Tax=Portunus trituberculatus TaxID=210409 RepID=A0A5B7J093_PORTR|nr:hypothetical protein [Portunus trituberculatus]